MIAAHEFQWYFPFLVSEKEHLRPNYFMPNKFPEFCFLFIFHFHYFALASYPAF